MLGLEIIFGCAEGEGEERGDVLIDICGIQRQFGSSWRSVEAIDFR